MQLEDWEENDLYRFSELPNMKKIGIDAGQTGLRLLGPIYLFMSVFRQSAVSRNVSQGYAKFQNPFDSTIQPLAMQVKGQTRLSLLQSIHSKSFWFLPLLSFWSLVHRLFLAFLSIQHRWIAAVVVRVPCLRVRVHPAL